MATATHTAVEALPDRGSVKEEIESNLANAARVDKQEKDKLEPVAVIGLSLKFPQDATSPEAFWQMLLDGRSALSDIPEDRFNADHFYHHDPTRTGTLNVRKGHFVNGNIASFDAPFFSIAPAEAACMDPQQRWILEIAYRAFENGVTAKSAIGSNTSVHIGSFTHDYETSMLRDPEMQKPYIATGVGTAMLANRLSWFYDLRGQSMQLDTACSSSLNALHLACQGLRNRESEMGIVGGCNLILNPDSMLGLTDLNFLSPDGEGAGIVVLKLLSKAIEDEDTIRAVIRATGSNQDGRTPGITQPSSQAQEALVRDTYCRGGLDMFTTRYFEAHGTGTALGDPIEASAINASFGTYRSQRDPLIIGAVKSNIGHLEGASGIASLIKTILVLENGVIPPNIWFERVNTKIPLDLWNIRFPSQVTPWPTEGLRRASVNSFGFGGSNAHAVLDDAYNYLRLRGLNGRHYTTAFPPNKGSSTLPNGRSVMDSSPIRANPGDEYQDGSQPTLFVWSASDEGGLKRLAGVYGDHIRTLNPAIREDTYLKNLAFTLSEKRTLLPWKGFTVAASLQALTTKLEAQSSKPVRSSTPNDLGFIFTGQGAQWNAMGRELFSYPEFKKSLLDAEAYIWDLGCTWSLIDELCKDRSTSKLDQPVFGQLACTALQVALVDLLRSWNIYPSAVVGHSSGEIAAAFCAGLITREFAWKIAYYRGIVVSRSRAFIREPETMMSVGLSESEVEPFLKRLSVDYGAQEVTVGCINSPKNVTLSGNEAQIDMLNEVLSEKGFFVRKLNVSIAYHSRSMNKVAAEYLNLIGSLPIESSSSSSAMMFSSVTGRQVFADEVKGGQYWAENLISPVRFLDAVKNLYHEYTRKRANQSNTGSAKLRIEHLLEIGPHAALRTPIRDTLVASIGGNHTTYGSMLIRGKPALETSLAAAGHIHCLGYPVRLNSINRIDQTSPEAKMLISLPEYPFDHTQYYWRESRLSKDYRFRKFPKHELLGTPVPDWNPLEARWRNIIRMSENPWVADHKVDGSVIYPAAGILLCAIQAAHLLSEQKDQITGYRIKGAIFQKALILSADLDGTETQLCLRPDRTSGSKSCIWHDFQLFTNENGQWVEICRGAVSIEYKEENVELDDGKERTEDHLCHTEIFRSGTRRCKMGLHKEILYDYLNSVGLSYGPAFQVLNDVYFNGHGEATARIDLHHWTTKVAGVNVEPHVMHPTALDGVFQLMVPALSNGGEKDMRTMVPTRVEDIWLAASGSNAKKVDIDIVRVFAQSKFEGHRDAISAIIALEEFDHKPCIIVSGFRSTAVVSRDQSLPNASATLCYNIEWKPDIELLDSHQIANLCEAATPGPFYENLAEEKELACFFYISRALNQGKSQEVLDNNPHLRRYWEWMQHTSDLFDTGTLNVSNARYEDITEQTEEWERICQSIEQKGGAEGKLIITAGKNISAILNGEINTLELLFTNNNEVLDEFYREGYGNGMGKLATYVDLLAHKNPAMKILEIGAGTGGATKRIVQALTRHGECQLGTPRFGKYCFTDISPRFFEKAAKIFNSHLDRVSFTVLNIEIDPQKQGYDIGSYDLVVAVNVLHVTSSLATTLRNTRRLLKPGGKLVLYELTKPQSMRAAIIFGSLPGWWLGTESFRKWGPLITQKKWNDLFIDNGFSGIDVALPDVPVEAYRMTDVMVATASKKPAKALKIPALAIVAAESSQQQAIAQELKLSLELMEFPSEILSLPDLDAHKTELDSFIFLIEIEEPLLYNVGEKAFLTLQNLAHSAPDLLWVTSGLNANPASSMVTGLARCLQSENANFRFVTLALENRPMVSQAAKHIMQAFKSSFLGSPGSFEPEMKQKDELIYVNRIVEAEYVSKEISDRTTVQQVKPRRFGEEPLRSLVLNIAFPGLLDTLEFVDETEFPQPLAPDEVEIKVSASGLIFRDVLIALGQITDKNFGLECAGVVTRVGGDLHIKLGDRVCCWAPGSFRTFARCKAATAQKIPDAMSFSSAAALPVAHCTAYYALVHVARLKGGKSVLIHSGAGGTGQAAIQLAKYLNAEVYVTVGNEEKKKLVMDQYGIPEDHIFSSRTLSFGKGIKRVSKGRGVDVVLNSLSGEALRTSFECVAPYGCFIEIGKKDIYAHGDLPMFPFSRNVSFAGVDLAAMLTDNSALLGELMQEVMDLLRKKQIWVPVPLHCYSVSRIEEAFRYMQSGKNTGKIVIEMNNEDLVPTVPSMTSSYDFDPKATYVIAGGLGGLGRSIARWMASRKARNMILLSRTATLSIAAKTLLEELRAKGIKVVTPPCDISDRDSLALALTECSKTLPRIRGCVQSSLVIKDGMFDTMSYENFRAVVAPKVQGSWNLHELLPNGLDFFVLLSSAAGVLGNRSQANYCCGNTYQDGLAHYRVSRGQKAVSLDIGIVLSVGYLSERQELTKSLRSQGYTALTKLEFLAILDYHCNPSLPLLSHLACQVVTGINTPAALRKSGIPEPYWMDRPLFRNLHQVGSTVTASTDTSGNLVNYQQLLLSAGSLADASDIACVALVEKLSKTLAVRNKDIDINQPLHVYGVDSLVAVEVRSWLNKALGADVAIFEILGTGTIAALGLTTAGKSSFVQDVLRKEAQ